MKIITWGFQGESNFQNTLYAVGGAVGASVEMPGNDHGVEKAMSRANSEQTKFVLVVDVRGLKASKLDKCIELMGLADRSGGGIVLVAEESDAARVAGLKSVAIEGQLTVCSRGQIGAEISRAIEGVGRTEIRGH